jgi:hypothetical protein
MTACPKQLAINIDNGLFTFEASLLAEWIANSNKCGEFIELFAQWLNDRDESVAEPYALADETIRSAGLKNFIDTVIESKKAKVKCKQCGAENDVSELLYRQYGAGTWIKRQLTCECGAVLYDAGMVSFQLREGAKLPDGVNQIIGNNIH